MSNLIWLTEVQMARLHPRPEVPQERTWKYDKRRYKRRNRIEIMFGRLKDWRRVATRYDSCPETYLSAMLSPQPSCSCCDQERVLTLAGAGRRWVFSDFPLAYAIVMPALNMPIILMLLVLVFRSVSFEYRWRTARWKGGGDGAVFGGSVIAALCRGIALGARAQGLAVADRAYAGGWFDWLTPFSILAGLAVVVGYALLGACWLVMKTEGAIHLRVRNCAGGWGRRRRS